MLDKAQKTHPKLGMQKKDDDGTFPYICGIRIGKVPSEKLKPTRKIPLSTRRISHSSSNLLVLRRRNLTSSPVPLTRSTTRYYSQLVPRAARVCFTHNSSPITCAPVYGTNTPSRRPARACDTRPRTRTHDCYPSTALLPPDNCRRVRHNTSSTSDPHTRQYRYVRGPPRRKCSTSVPTPCTMTTSQPWYRRSVRSNKMPFGRSTCVTERSKQRETTYLLLE